MVRVLALTLFVLITSALRAQDVRLGVDLGADVVFPSADFITLPGIAIPDGATSFGSTTSTAVGVRLGLSADVPLFALQGKSVRGGLRLNVTSVSPAFSAAETAPIARGDTVYRATIGHTVDMTMTAVVIEPFLSYPVLDWLNVGLGVQLSSVSGSAFTQTQQFTDPPGLPFVDGSIVQQTASGTISGFSPLSPLVNLRAEGKIPFRPVQGISLAPWVQIVLPLASQHSTASLTLPSLGFGVGIRYDLGGATSQPEPMELPRFRDTIYVRDTVVVLSSTVRTATTARTSVYVDSIVSRDSIRYRVTESFRTVVPKPPSVLHASVHVDIIDDNDETAAEAYLRVRRIRRTRVASVAPAILFDGDSVGIPQRYVQSGKGQRGWTADDALLDTATHWHYRVLDILGSRMAAQNGVNVTLASYDDGTEEGKLRARRRADAVRNYFKKVWNIALQRMTIDIRPGQAAQPGIVVVEDESRRVLGPLRATDYIVETSLPRIRVTPKIVSDAAIYRLGLRLLQRGRVVRVIDSVTQTVPPFVDVDMSDGFDVSTAITDPVLVELTAENVEGASTRSEPARIIFKTRTTGDIANLPSVLRTDALSLVTYTFLETPDDELGISTLTVPTSIDAANVLWVNRGLHDAERPLYTKGRVLREERK